MSLTGIGDRGKTNGEWGSEMREKEETENPGQTERGWKKGNTTKTGSWVSNSRGWRGEGVVYVWAFLSRGIPPPWLSQARRRGTQYYQVHPPPLPSAHPTSVYPQAPKVLRSTHKVKQGGGTWVPRRGTHSIFIFSYKWNEHFHNFVGNWDETDSLWKYFSSNCGTAVWVSFTVAVMRDSSIFSWFILYIQWFTNQVLPSERVQLAVQRGPLVH